MKDVWQEYHGFLKDYTHYAGRHGSYSRIDYIFQYNTTGVGTIDIPISLRVYSDLAHLLIQWEFKVKQWGPGSWRSDKFLLMNAEVVTKVSAEMLVFFQSNGEMTDKIMLWETFKAYIWGVLISQGAHKRKKSDWWRKKY